MDDLQKAFFCLVFAFKVGNRGNGVFFVFRLRGNAIWGVGAGCELSKVCWQVARATEKGQNSRQTEIKEKPFSSCHVLLMKNFLENLPDPGNDEEFYITFSDIE